MSEFFQRYVDELLDDEEFRARHPHFHVRLIPTAELAFVEVPTLTGKALREYNKTLAALLRGDRAGRLTVDIIEDADTLALASGDPILQAARDAGVDEVWARLRYDSREVAGAWWSGAGVPGATNTTTLELLLTEDGESIVSEDDIALVG